MTTAVIYIGNHRHKIASSLCLARFSSATWLCAICKSISFLKRLENMYINKYLEAINRPRALSRVVSEKTIRINAFAELASKYTSAYVWIHCISVQTKHHHRSHALLFYFGPSIILAIHQFQVHYAVRLKLHINLHKPKSTFRHLHKNDLMLRDDNMEYQQLFLFVSWALLMYFSFGSRKFWFINVVNGKIKSRVSEGWNEKRNNVQANTCCAFSISK